MSLKIHENCVCRTNRLYLEAGFRHSLGGKCINSLNMYILHCFHAHPFEEPQPTEGRWMRRYRNSLLHMFALLVATISA
jgi:hypothetical protein